MTPFWKKPFYFWEGLSLQVLVKRVLPRKNSTQRAIYPGPKK
jgi:hypothetical protein